MPNGRSPRSNPRTRAWTAKDERKYEHIKEGLLDDGSGEDKAQEIAARTVNKSRRLEGRTQNKRTQGTGNPTNRLDERTRDELYNIAKERKIAGRSSMSKADLVAAIRGKAA